MKPALFDKLKKDVFLGRTKSHIDLHSNPYLQFLRNTYKSFLQTPITIFNFVAFYINNFYEERLNLDSGSLIETPFLPSDTFFVPGNWAESHRANCRSILISLWKGNFATGFLPAAQFKTRNTYQLSIKKLFHLPFFYFQNVDQMFIVNKMFIFISLFLLNRSS